MLFETKDGNLNLDYACGEIVLLYKIFGLEDDKNLNKDAIELKKKIRMVVKTIKDLPN